MNKNLLNNILIRLAINKDSDAIIQVLGTKLLQTLEKYAMKDNIKTLWVISSFSIPFPFT